MGLLMELERHRNILDQHPYTGFLCEKGEPDYFHELSFLLLHAFIPGGY